MSKGFRRTGSIGLRSDYERRRALRVLVLVFLVFLLFFGLVVFGFGFVFFVVTFGKGT